jgi:hypothetical protein
MLPERPPISPAGSATETRGARRGFLSPLSLNFENIFAGESKEKKKIQSTVVV